MVEVRSHAGKISSSCQNRDCLWNEEAARRGMEGWWMKNEGMKG